MSQNDIAEIVYEPRDYPDCPEGEYIAVCVKSELKDSPVSEYNPQGLKKINMRWEILKDARTGQEVFYIDQTDPEKKKRHYMVFPKPMSQSFGERSNVHKTFKELTGLGVDCVLEKRTENRQFEGSAAPRAVTVVRFDQRIFENMVAVLKVKHEAFETKTGEERMGVNVTSIEATVAQKYENYNIIRRLPGVPEFPEVLMKKLQEANGQPAAPAPITSQDIAQTFPAPTGGPVPHQAPAVGFNVPVPQQMQQQAPFPGAPIPTYAQQQVPLPGALPQQGAPFHQPVPGAPAGHHQVPGLQGHQQAPAAPGFNAQPPAHPQAPQAPFVSPQGTTMGDLPADWQ